MAHTSYSTDFDLMHDMFKSEAGIERVATRFGITEDEAARNLLSKREYEEWAKEHNER